MGEAVIFMELRQIVTFIQVAQTGSFSLAAKNLGYSQSAATVHIRLLETELGTRLFDRLGKRVLLTAQGEKFLNYANTILYEVERAKNSMSDNCEMETPLRVGVIQSLCTFKLPSIVRAFQDAHPKALLNIVIASPEELIDMMNHNDLDIIYILDIQRWDTHWNKVMEIREPIVFVAPPNHRLVGKRNLRLEEILSESFFLTEKNANYRHALDSVLASRKLTVTPVLEISDTMFILQLLETSEALSFLPFFAVSERVRGGRLAVLDVIDADISMYHQIFYHKNKYKTREMEKFIEVTKASF